MGTLAPGAAGAGETSERGAAPRAAPREHEAGRAPGVGRRVQVCVDPVKNREQVPELYLELLQTCPFRI